MKNLIAFLTKHSNWFVFVVLEVFSLVLLFQYNSYLGSSWFSTANYFAGKFYEVDSQVESFFSLTTVNQELTQRNLYLEQEIRQLNERIISLTQDSSSTNGEKLKALEGMKLIPAKVVNNMLNTNNNLMTINKGSADGVKEDMGVVSGTGVVGIVYLVSSHYSVVIPILNSQTNISCMIKGRGYFGTLNWTGRERDKAFVEDVPRHAKFKLGDEVVTSGYSSVFPEGILIGKILHVYNSSNGMAYRLQVQLSTDFGKLRDVCVVDNAKMNEQMKLLHAAQDSLRSRNN